MIRTITIMILIMLAGSVSAQEPDRKNLIITAVPQHILNNAIQFEADIPMADQSKWLTIAPSFFYRAEDFGDAFNHPEYEKLSGAGVDVLKRKYFTPETHGEGFYFSYGGGYRFLKITADEYLWKKNPSEGLEWYRMNFTEFDIKIHGLNAKCTAGYQMEIYNNLVADMYVGFGFRYAFVDEPDGNFLKFNRNVNDYAYRGMLLVGGLRIGIGW